MIVANDVRDIDDNPDLEFQNSQNNSQNNSFDSEYSAQFNAFEKTVKGNKVKYICGKININNLDGNDMYRTFKTFNENTNITDINNNRYIGVIHGNKYDKFIIYIPRKNNKIPKTFIPETFLSQSMHIIDMKLDDGYKRKHSHGYLYHYDGYLLILSFWLMNKNHNHCYLYANGEITKMFPEYIYKIWPQLFTTKNKEQQHVSNELTQKIKEIRSIF